MLTSLRLIGDPGDCGRIPLSRGENYVDGILMIGLQ